MPEKLIKPTSALFQQALQEATEAILAKIPKLEIVCRDVRREDAVVIRYPSISTKNTIWDSSTFNVSNTREKFIYYDSERENKIIIFVPVNLYYFYKIVKISSYTENFLLFVRNFFSFIWSMELITLEMLLGRILYSEINVQKPILESSRS